MKLYKESWRKNKKIRKRRRRGETQGRGREGMKRGVEEEVWYGQGFLLINWIERITKPNEK